MMNTIKIFDKENLEGDRQYWAEKSPDERLSAVEFRREQFYAIQGYTSLPRLTKKIHITDNPN